MSTMSPSTTMKMIPEHRAAISLNNTGVALLERRCYRQGLRTLSNAVAVMNAAFRRIEEQKGGDEVSPADEPHYGINTMLHQATQRLAYPEILVENRTLSHYDLKVLSDYQNPSVLQEQPNHYTPSISPSPTSSTHCTISYLLRIEALDCEAPTKHIYDLQSSIILYNFAIAYRCMADVTDDLHSKHELLVAAMQLFHLSYSILTTASESHLEGKLGDLPLRRLILTATLVLQNLVQLSALLGLDQYGEEYNRRLENMRNSAGFMQDLSHEGFAAEAA
jgi:hypothetical protein